ncbi:MAG: hypothetical protein QOJ46_1528 [bacterium]
MSGVLPHTRRTSPRAGSRRAMTRILPRSPGARAVLYIVGFFVVANIVALVVSTVRPEPGGENSSAYATQPRGAAAYAELLRRAGHDVSYLRAPLADAQLDPGATVVLLDAPSLDRAGRATLRGFVHDGGRLVAGGASAGRGVVPGAPLWRASGPQIARPSVPVAETSAVRTVQSAGAGAFQSAGGTLPVLGSLMTVAQSGRGRALLLADAAPLQNRLLGHADNAALGLALAGPAQRPVTFVESIHGFDERTGLAALPARWKVALLAGILAALLWLASRARRFGPPEESGGEPPPARREHVDALAIALRRARQPARALEPVQAAARAQVIRRCALAPNADDGAVREAALRLGFEEDEVAALTGERGANEALALGRALSRGRR